MKEETLVAAPGPPDSQKEVIESIFERAREAADEVLGHTTVKDIAPKGSGGN
jgi:hypothetical protein